MVEPARPLLNPVLALRVEPKREVATGGGKSAADIRHDRLEGQRRVLATTFDEIYRAKLHPPTFGGKLQLIARMYDDSLAPTKTPTALFAPRQGAQLIAPLRNGYLVEIDMEALPRLSRFARNEMSVAGQVDISRVESVHAFGREDVLRGRNLDELWKRAPEFENGRGFLISFAPFRDAHAREQLVERLMQLSADRVLLPTFPSVRLPVSETEVEMMALPIRADSQTSLAIGMRRYRNTGRARTTVQIDSKEAMSKIVSSGTVFRLTPLSPIELTTPGEGAHPGILPPSLANEPIVGVVDGGRTAKTYDSAEAWQAPALVPDGVADHKHGNRITALVVHGHAWNTNLPLPGLFCRFGAVQAVPNKNAHYPPEPQKLVSYLERVIAQHRDTRVWNLSFNEVLSCDPDQVSFLGHELARIARAYEVLPVISVGNKSPDRDRIAPPADCEAALVVAGRKSDQEGKPSDPCDVSLPGPGPEGMLKPDLSWYSKLRLLGGNIETASSWATPLISGLAAHTFQNLKEPTPDLVRALLINGTDFDAYEPQRGWGSPDSQHLPWNCQPGTVTLAWRGSLRPGQEYYWESIPIPPSLVKNGKLCGRGWLTAILNPHPLVSDETDANYFAARLAVALQYTSENGSRRNLLGGMEVSELPEQVARTALFKWQPVRRHCESFRARGFSGKYFRLRARVFVRDLYQFALSSNADVEPLDVAFVLTLSDGSNTSNLYNEMRATLGTFVESAVIDQEIDVEV